MEFSITEGKKQLWERFLLRERDSLFRYCRSKLLYMAAAAMLQACPDFVA